MGWMKQVFNPEYDWVFRTKAQANVKNVGTTPDGKPDPSFYWSRYAFIIFSYTTRAQLFLQRQGTRWELFHQLPLLDPSSEGRNRQ